MKQSGALLWCKFRAECSNPDSHACSDETVFGLYISSELAPAALCSCSILDLPFILLLFLPLLTPVCFFLFGAGLENTVSSAAVKLTSSCLSGRRRLTLHLKPFEKSSMITEARHLLPIHPRAFISGVCFIGTLWWVTSNVPLPKLCRCSRVTCGAVSTCMMLHCCQSCLLRCLASYFCFVLLLSRAAALKCAATIASLSLLFCLVAKKREAYCIS